VPFRPDWGKIRSLRLSQGKRAVRSPGSMSYPGLSIVTTRAGTSPWPGPPLMTAPPATNSPTPSGCNR
jgi:hypothetical protein